MSGAPYPQFSSNYPLRLTAFMQRPVRLYPDATAVVYREPHTGQTQRFTWREWYARTCRLANALLGLGLRAGRPGDPGDRVATIALNHHYHLELYYAVPCIGAVLHTINMRLAREQIVHTIRHAGDRVLVFDDTFAALVDAMYEEIEDTVEFFVCISESGEGPDTRIENLILFDDLVGAEQDEIEWPRLHEDTKATLCYTTGTTGMPKGVMFSHRAIYLMVLHAIAHRHFDNDPQGRSAGELAVPLFTVPLYHAHGWGLPYSAVYSASTIVLPGRFDVEGFCELVQSEKVTSSAFVPTVLAMLLDHPRLDDYDLSSLESLSVGGAALSAGLESRAQARIPGFVATSGYGMTETAPTAVLSFLKKTLKDLPPAERVRLQVRAGLPIPGLEVEVVDEQGQPVPRDDATIGEIVLRGPWIMDEYYREPERSAEAWRDGWFHTGDLARVDEEGYLAIMDRISDVIRSGGEMVPTVLIEHVLMGGGFAAEAAVVGTPHPRWGERPMAIVVPAGGIEVSPAEVLAHLREAGVETGRIARWMLPDHVLVTDSIPKTSVGKIDKAAIRADIDAWLARAHRVHES